jgi:hypothetical protein
LRNPSKGYLLQVNLGGLSSCAVAKSRRYPELSQLHDRSGNIGVDPQAPIMVPGQHCQMFFSSKSEWKAATKAAKMVMRHYSEMLRY